MSDSHKVITLTVNAIDLGDCIVLVDRLGRRVGRPMERSSIEGALDPDALARWRPTWKIHDWSLLDPRWEPTIRRAVSKLMKRVGDLDRDAWAAKADSLSRSVSMRARTTPVTPTGKTRLETYATTTWHAARHRLWHQLHGRFRKHRMSGWQKWSHTVSNRLNKRKGCRYGQGKYEANGHHGDADHGDDRESGLQVRFDWSRADSGDGVD